MSVSNSSEPSEKMSERASTGRPQACSGLMYWSLPLSAPICVFEALVTALTMPKSHSLMSPSKLIRTFWGETSRCTRPSWRPSKSFWRWAWSSAEASREATSSARPMGSALPRSRAVLRIVRRSLPSTYSIAMK